MENKMLRKLLIVDDDEDILFVVEAALEGMKEVEIQYATSGLDAFEKAKTFHPDMIIMDVLMPIMGGVEALQLMRKEPFLQEIPIIFFTARAQVEELAFYKSLSVLDVLVKPFDAPKLAFTIENMWQQSFKTGREERR